MIIKVCGLREAENIRAISELGNVNMLGFNFCPDSPRFIRIHRAYLVNRAAVTGVDVDLLYIGDIQLPISRKYKDTVTAQF